MVAESWGTVCLHLPFVPLSRILIIDDFLPSKIRTIEKNYVRIYAFVSAGASKTDEPIERISRRNWSWYRNILVAPFVYNQSTD